MTHKSKTEGCELVIIKKTRRAGDEWKEREEEKKKRKSLLPIKHTPGPRSLRIVVGRAWWCHHATHSDYTPRPRPVVIGVLIHLASVVEIYRATRLMGYRSRLSGLLARGLWKNVRHRRLARREIWHGRTRSHRAVISGVIHPIRCVPGIVARGLLIGVRAERVGMNSSLGDLR